MPRVRKCCATCKWWIRLDFMDLHPWEQKPPFIEPDNGNQPTFGECIRYPPQPVGKIISAFARESRKSAGARCGVNNAVSIVNGTVFPHTHELQQCGEHKPKGRS